MLCTNVNRNSFDSSLGFISVAAAATAMFKERGAKVDPIRVSPTKAILSNITDPNGVRIELSELPPESQHRQAMERWK